jgi:hypothetical protein
MGLSVVALLSLSQAISLSLLNDKKKEEGRRRRVGGEAVSREKKWERRKKRRKKKEIRKKFNVLGCRIILCIFFRAGNFYTTRENDTNTTQINR